MDTHSIKAWSGPFVWSGTEMSNSTGWAVQLCTQDIDDIATGVESFTASGKSLADAEQADFPFGQFDTRLKQIQEQLLHGCGFILLRGLPSDDWTNHQLITAYWGLGQHLGTPVSQNAKAHLLGHVIDQRTVTTGDTRIYQTNRAQPFHSDSCDIVGLLCLQTAKDGGESAVASSAAIHNELLNTDLQSLATLYGEFMCDRYGEVPEGKLPYYPVNIFNNVDDQLVCCGMDPDIRSAQRLDAIEALTPEQLRALDQFQATARKLAIRMTLQRGDIQFVNNLVAVHARETFVDHTDAKKRRHLVRLWLSAAKGRALPEFLRERWGNIECGTVRGGIKVPGAIPVVQLNPDN